MGAVINGYVMNGEFTTADAGMCRWGFAVKDGHEFFIKEFLAPKYPIDEAKLGPDLTKIMREAAETFYYKRKAYYDRIRLCRNGNIMVPMDFFREGSKYYQIMDRVTGRLLDVDEVAALEDNAKQVLIKSLMYSIMQLHRQAIVHSDLKPENILIKTTSDGYCTAKIIDFDAGFFESEVPDNVEGSQNYFAPEILRRMKGEEIPITTKADIFALGLLIHQYWCAEMPAVPEKYSYVFEAVLDGTVPVLDSRIPEDLQDLIGKMLSKEAEDRPDAETVWHCLCGASETEREPRDVETPATKRTESGGAGRFLVPSDDELE